MVDLLIVGAGPCGLTAAVEAKRLGLSFRIIERKDARSVHDSRALVVHARVLELLAPLGNGSVIEKIMETSIQNPTFNIHLDKNTTLSQSPAESPWGDTDYPCQAWLPQCETERILEEALISGGDVVDYGVCLDGLSQTANQVASTLRHKSGKVETFTSKYVLGCDGGRSKTRELIGIDMHRSPSSVYFIVADIKLVGTVPFEKDKEMHIFPNADGIGGMLPLPDGYRLLFQTPKGVTNKSELVLDKAFFESLLLERTGLKFEVELGKWQTIFEVTHGVSDKFRKGRVMLAGDAGHVHSPVGGQGMNDGMTDVLNLLWKLAWAERCNKEFPSSSEASIDMILDSYNAERYSMGAELIKNVDISTAIVSTRNPIVQKIRNFVMWLAFQKAAKENFPSVGQLHLKYNPAESRILFPKATGIFHLGGDNNYVCHAGERLPNLRLSSGAKLHQHVNREQHTWVFLNMPVSKNLPANPNVICVQASTDQVSIPVISEETLTKPQVILVRPDLWVAGVAASYEELWEQINNDIDESSATTM